VSLMSHRTALPVLTALALAAGSIGPARAQPAPAAPAAPDAAPSDKERARVLHETGLRHYEAHQYGRAIAAYRKAYAIVPAPGILFNLAQAYRLRGDCRRAHRAYRSFLRVGGDTPEARVAREHVTSLRACAAREEKEKQLAEAAAAGGATASTTPPAPITGPTPASPAGSPSPELESGAVFDQDAAPPAAAAAPSVDLASHNRDIRAGYSRKRLGLGVGVAGAALTVVGVYFGLQASSKASDLDDFFEMGGTWTPELAEREDDLGRDRTLALSFGIVGAGAMGAGAVIYWLGHRETTAAEAARRSSLSLAPHDEGAVLQWRGEF